MASFGSLTQSLPAPAAHPPAPESLTLLGPPAPERGRRARPDPFRCLAPVPCLHVGPRQSAREVAAIILESSPWRQACWRSRSESIERTGHPVPGRPGPLTLRALPPAGGRGEHWNKADFVPFCPPRGLWPGGLPSLPLRREAEGLARRRGLFEASSVTSCSRSSKFMEFEKRC